MASHAHTRDEERPFLALAAALALAVHAGVLFFTHPAPSHPVLQKVEETSTEVDLIKSIAEPFPEPITDAAITAESTKTIPEPTPQAIPAPTREEASISKAETQPASAATEPALNEPATVPVASMPPPRQRTAKNNEASPSTKETSNPRPSDKPALHPVYKVPPSIKYPVESRAAGEQGTVLLRITVNSEGKPIAVSVITSSGHNRLDRAAIEGGWRCRISNSFDGAQFEAPLRFSLRE